MLLLKTRELCVQIENQAKDLSYQLPIKTALIIGGVGLPPQVSTNCLSVVLDFLKGSMKMFGCSDSHTSK
jgi:hypothetical protein